MADPLRDVKVTGADIVRIYNKVMPVITGESSDAVFLSFLGIALLTQVPDLDPEKLVPSVQALSEIVSTYAADLNNPFTVVN